ncbi:hypothetical protein KIM372_06350 [Bombiscardovia nodaiensis]|uniref:Uncharacterized protein n=1 Tax=Bombiscardovia nodaiensis TaxID=2932181 RepID=A0ABM8B791_9BIFI|nr:hypothetical protein KIM372_06350 [Bombiscardovia nodaiensis]
MEQTTIIFNGAISLELPEDFVAASQEEAEAFLLRVNNGEHGGEGQMAPDQLLRAHSLAADSLYRSKDQKQTFMMGEITPVEWRDTDLEAHLGDYYQWFMHTQPLMKNVNMGARRLDLQAGGDRVGLLNYTFATPYDDWYVCFFLLPADGHEAWLLLMCSTNENPSTAFQFVGMGNSLGLAHSSSAQAVVPAQGAQQ